MTAAPAPTEKKITTGIRYANAGMICIASRIGVIVRRKRSERPARTPSGTPTASESETAASISDSVCMLSSQRPSTAKDAKLANMISAARRPPKRRASSVPSAVVPAQVSFVRTSYSQPTSVPSPEPIPSRIR